MANPAGKEIDISNYSLKQLQGVHQTVATELNVLQRNMGSLRVG